jgi:hypothetical protein
LVVDHSAAIKSKIYGKIKLTHIIKDRSKGKKAATKKAAESSVAALVETLTCKAPQASTA